MHLFFKRFHRIGILVVLVCSLFMVTTRITAQDGGYLVQVTGTLNAVNTTTIVVDGINYTLAPGVVISTASIGTVVTITGEFSGNSTIVVISISAAQPSATPTLTATGTSATSVAPTQTSTPATATPGVTPTPGSVIIEGPVKVININIITIYNTNIWLEPSDPMLKKIKLGDWLRIHGHHDNKGMVVATQVTTISNTTTQSTVTLEGVVQNINGTTITINGINAQLDPSNPILTTLKVGDVLNVEGDFQGNGTTFVLIVVNVVIINNTNVIINSACWWHVTAMGGHWHCDDGMGMGKPPCPDGMGMGMGMGEPADAMGMGDPQPPAMGMGHCDEGMGMGQ